MDDKIVTKIVVTRLGYKNENSGAIVPDDTFTISGKFDFLTFNDRDIFLNDPRQTFEIISPCGCTVEVSK